MDNQTDRKASRGDRITPERLEELKKLCEDATPGPWWQYREGIDSYQNGGLCADVDGDTELWGGYDGCMPNSEDIEFMAQSRTAIPELIAEVEFMWKVAEQMRQMGYFEWREADERIRIDNQPVFYHEDERVELAQYLKRKA